MPPRPGEPPRGEGRITTRFLYLVRHGDASPHDGPLSPAGQERARLTGRRLKDVPFSAVYHGPLPRAAQTANCAVTILACQPGLPTALITFNDASPLPPELRWTGFPATLRPASA